MCVDGYVLTCSLYGVQLTFLMNRGPMILSVQRTSLAQALRQWGRSVGTPSCNFICKYAEHGPWSSRGKESSRVGG